MALPSSDEVIKALLKDGFLPRGKSRRGSHQVFKKESSEGTKIVVVPLGRKEIPRGTLRSIVRQAGHEARNVAALLR